MNLKVHQPVHQYDPPRYLPTPEEIRQKCLAFQARWTEAERRHRTVAAYAVKPYQTPRVQIDAQDVLSLAS